MNVAEAYSVVNTDSLTLNTSDMHSTPAHWAIPGRYKDQSPIAQISSTCYVCVNGFFTQVWRVLIHGYTLETQFRPLCVYTYASKADPGRTVTCHIKTSKALTCTHYYYVHAAICGTKFIMMLLLNHKFMPDSKMACLGCWCSCHYLTSENIVTALFFFWAPLKESTQHFHCHLICTQSCCYRQKTGSTSAGMFFTCVLMTCVIYMAMASARATHLVLCDD